RQAVDCPWQRHDCCGVDAVQDEPGAGGLCRRLYLGIPRVGGQQRIVHRDARAREGHGNRIGCAAVQEDGLELAGEHVSLTYTVWISSIRAVWGRTPKVELTVWIYSVFGAAESRGAWVEVVEHHT